MDITVNISPRVLRRESVRRLMNHADAATSKASTLKATATKTQWQRVLRALEDEAYSGEVDRNTAESLKTAAKAIRKALT